MNLKRVIGIVLAGVFAVLGVGIVRRIVASDETRMRWVIEDMLEGFNDTELAPVMAGFAPDFVDRASNVRRAELREALIHVFFEDVDPTTHEFLYHAELAPDGLAFERGDGDAYRVTLKLDITRHRGSNTEVFWNAHIEGEMKELDDGWAWTHTTSVNHADRRRR